jgi:hypothetical protein
MDGRIKAAFNPVMHQALDQLGRHEQASPPRLRPTWVSVKRVRSATEMEGAQAAGTNVSFPVAKPSPSVIKKDI